MGKAIGGAAGVLGLLLAAAWAGPMLVDVQAHKPALERRLSESLGRSVTLSGPMSARLLPSPALTVQGAQLANLPGLAPSAMASAERLSVRLAILPLLAGRVVADSVVVESPSLVLQRTGDGRANWLFTPQADTGGQGRAPSDDKGDQGPDIRQLELRNGTLLLAGVAGPVERIDDLDVTLEAGDGGSWTSDGTAVLLGHRVAITGSRGAPDAAGSSLLTVAIESDAAKGSLRLAGRLSASNQFDGRLTATADRLGALFAGGGVKLLEAPFKLDAALRADAAAASLDKLSVSLGRTRGDGEGHLDFAAPAAALRVKFALLDLDEALAAVPVSAPTARTAAAIPTGPRAAGTIGGPAPEQGFALPTGFGFDLDLSAERMAWRGGAIRDAVLRAGLEDGALNIRQATALLPGEAEATAVGFLAAQDGAPMADLTVEAQAADLRGTLSWLGLDVGAVPADRLRRASAAGRLVWTPAELRVTDAWAKIDTSHADLAATVRLGGKRPAFGASVVVDRLDWDAYRPRPVAPMAATTATPSASPALPAEPGLLSAIDANLQLRVGELLVLGQTARQLRFDGTLMLGNLTLRELLVGDLAGSALKASGTVAGITADPELRGLLVELRAREPQALMEALGLGLDLSRLESLAISSTLDGNREALRTATRIEAGGGIIALNGSVEQPFETARRATFGLEASHSSFADFVRHFAPDYHPRSPLGAFALTGQMQADAQSASLSDLRMKLGTVSAAGEAAAQLVGTPKFDLKLTTGEIIVPAFLPASGTAGQGFGDWLGAKGARPTAYRPATPARAEQWSGEELPSPSGFEARLALQSAALVFDNSRLDDAELRLTSAGGTLRLDHLAGQFFGGRLQAQGQVNAKGRTEGRLAVANARLRESLMHSLGLDLIDGTGDFAAIFTAQGRSEAEIAASLDGRALLELRDGSVQGFDLGAASRRAGKADDLGGLVGLLQAGLTGGATRFSTLTGSFTAKDGIVTSDQLDLRAEGGVGTGELRLDLPRQSLASAFAFSLAGQGAAPPVVMRIEGPLGATRKTIDVNELQRWLAGRGVNRPLGGSLGKALDRLQHPPAPTAAPRPTVGSEPLPPPGEVLPPKLVPAAPAADPKLAELRALIGALRH